MSKQINSFYKELAEAQGIIDKFPQAKREDLIIRLRSVQYQVVSEASQAEARQFASAASSRNRQESERPWRTTAPRSGSFQCKDQEQKEKEKRQFAGGSAMEVDQDAWKL